MQNNTAVRCNVSKLLTGTPSRLSLGGDSEGLSGGRPSLWWIVAPRRLPRNSGHLLGGNNKQNPQEVSRSHHEALSEDFNSEVDPQVAYDWSNEAFPSQSGLPFL